MLMNSHTAITWIRDGTLIDRMPENAVAFGLASQQHLNRDRTDITVEYLINWGLKESGVSAEQKMRLLNEAREHPIQNTEDAVRLYTTLAEAVGPQVEYFEGAPELVRALADRGAINYLTSAIQQQVLDVWSATEQGQQVAPDLIILGDGPHGQKGQEHFEHIRRQGAQRILAVGDAEREIQDAHRFADAAIGIVVEHTQARVLRAFERLLASSESTPLQLVQPLPFALDLDQLILPSESELTEKLQAAGASKVIAGCREELMFNLRTYFESEGL